MTFVLENKIVEKDLPILGLDSLGLPETGNTYIFFDQKKPLVKAVDLTPHYLEF